MKVLKIWKQLITYTYQRSQYNIYNKLIAHVHARALLSNEDVYINIKLRSARFSDNKCRALFNKLCYQILEKTRRGGDTITYEISLTWIL